MSLGQRLRTARRARGLSARGLDKAAGFREGYASLVENGKRPRIGADVAIRYAAALEVPVEWLIAGTGDPPALGKPAA